MQPIPDEFIDLLSQGSDTQLDASLKPRLQLLKGRADDGVKTEVLAIISDCINGSLCSGFVLTILQTVVWVEMCGGKLDDAVGKIRCTPVA
jgi:hypothetical protein